MYSTWKNSNLSPKDPKTKTLQGKQVTIEQFTNLYKD